jgi:hypothetical protein
MKVLHGTVCGVQIGIERTIRNRLDVDREAATDRDRRIRQHEPQFAVLSAATHQIPDDGERGAMAAVEPLDRDYRRTFRPIKLVKERAERWTWQCGTGHRQPARLIRRLPFSHLKQRARDL